MSERPFSLSFTLFLFLSGPKPISHYSTLRSTRCHKNGPQKRKTLNCPSTCLTTKNAQRHSNPAFAVKPKRMVCWPLPQKRPEVSVCRRPNGETIMCKVPYPFQMSANVVQMTPDVVHMMRRCNSNNDPMSSK